jgi:ubiquinone/menaquinone biosynthesis C-methylase UbiE
MDFVDPRIVVSQFHLRPGDRVGDFGTGVGHYLSPLSRAVGSEGKVFGVEIQKNLAAAAADLVRKEQLSNVETIWGDLEAPGGTKITEETLEAVLFSNTLSMIEQKEVALEEAKRTLRKGGKLLVIDWADSFGGMGPAPASVVTEAQAKEHAARVGFTFERAFAAGGHHYGLSFRKG